MENRQYFDEMSILDSDKELRTDMCNDLSDSIYDEFQKYDKDSNNFDKKLALILTLLFFKFEILDETVVSFDICISYVNWKMDSLSSEINSDNDIPKNTLDILNEIAEDAKSVSDTTAKTIEIGRASCRERV